MPEPVKAFPMDQPEPSSMVEARANLVDWHVLRSQLYERQQLRARREGAHPDLLEWEKVFLRRMGKLGIPMFCHELWRSEEKQLDLYSKGVTKARPGKSAHQYGCALDMIHSEKGWGLSDKEWLLIGHIGKEVSGQLGLHLEWGGDWRKPNPAAKVGWDPAHWQIPSDEWKAIKKLFDTRPGLQTVQDVLNAMEKEKQNG
jgi:hypothetical protein